MVSLKTYSVYYLRLNQEELDILYNTLMDSKDSINPIIQNITNCLIDNYSGDYEEQDDIPF